MSGTFLDIFFAKSLGRHPSLLTPLRAGLSVAGRFFIASQVHLKPRKDRSRLVNRVLDFVRREPQLAVCFMVGINHRLFELVSD